MPIAAYLYGTSTLATTHAFSTTAGTPATAWPLDIFLDRGTPGGVANNVRLQVEVYESGMWKTSGTNSLDKAEWAARITGFWNPGNDPLFVGTTRDWTPIGSGLPFDLPALRGDCAHSIEIRYAPRLDTSSASGSITWRLAISYSENLEAAGIGVSEAGGVGILTGVGDPRISEWTKAPAVTESGSPDAYVQIGRRWAVLRGVSRRWVAEQVELDQTDSTHTGINPGEAYVAILTQGTGGVTATKGVKALLAAVVAPAAPAGELPLARVIVGYQAGGTSVIVNANITVYADDGRGRVVATTGLVVSVARLRALVDRAVITRPIAELVTVADDAASTVWLTSSGAISLTAGSLALASVTAAGGVVTAVTDLRTYVEPGMQLIVLRAQATESIASEWDRTPIPFRWNLDRLAVSILHASDSATGSTDVNLVRWSAGANADVCPGDGLASIPAQACVGDDGWPTVTTGQAGDWLTLSIMGATSGGTQAYGVSVTAFLYPLRGLAA